MLPSTGKLAQFAPGNDCGNPRFIHFNWYNPIIFCRTGHNSLLAFL